MGILSRPWRDGLSTNVSHGFLSTVEPNSFFLRDLLLYFIKPLPSRLPHAIHWESGHTAPVW